MHLCFDITDLHTRRPEEARPSLLAADLMLSMTCCVGERC